MVDTTRFSGIFSVSHINVLVIGAGGIGGPTALSLAKMGVNSLWIVDGDVVSSENTGTQLFGVDDVDELKCWVLADHIERLTSPDENIRYSYGRYPKDMEFADDMPSTFDVVISAVDSIASRQDIWEGLKFLEWSWFIDPRMGAENFQMYVVQNGTRQVDWYENIISGQDDKSIPDLPCTSKATFYTGLIAGGLVGSAVSKISRMEDVPFFYTFDIRELNLEIFA